MNKEIKIGFYLAVPLSLIFLYLHFAYANGQFPFKPEFVCKQFHLNNLVPLPTATSPDGKWKAEINVEGCGKQHDNIHEYLTLHPVNENRDISRQERIFEIGDIGHPTVRWTGDRALEVVFESIVAIEGLNLPKSYKEIQLNYVSQHGEKLLGPSPLGDYGLLSTYCGKNEIPENVTSIPWIGCFYLAAGHSTTGIASGHKVEIAVNTEGQEAFTVDGALVADVRNSQLPNYATNLPFVHRTGDGYSLCADSTDASCLTMFGVFSRNPDKSVLFTVSQCFPPPPNKLCVMTQENWDFEKSRHNQIR